MWSYSSDSPEHCSQCKLTRYFKQFTHERKRISGNCRSILPSCDAKSHEKFIREQNKIPTPFQIFVALKTPFYFMKRHPVTQKHSTEQSNVKSMNIPSSIDLTTGYVLYKSLPRYVQR